MQELIHICSKKPPSSYALLENPHLLQQILKLLHKSPSPYALLEDTHLLQQSLMLLQQGSPYASLEDTTLLQQILKLLQEALTFLRILGSYPSALANSKAAPRSPHLPTHFWKAPRCYRLGSKSSESDDGLLGGLLSEDIDRLSCQSRGMMHHFRPKSKYKPSSYLVEQLRKYESLHKRCAPGTEGYLKGLQLLQGGQASDSDCRYIIWISYSGLGNRIVSITAAFVYALLTNRVLLVDGGQGIAELFCEPFPGASWLLPSDFPFPSVHSFNETSPYRFGHWLNTSAFSRSENALSSSFGSTYLHLTHSYDFYDKLVFCQEEQDILNHIPWLFLKSNLYFVPHLYLFVPSFREKLDQLFPERETVFHHIGRYLFHPTNDVWRWITRFYHAYLSIAEKRVGIQVRSFDSHYPVEQVIACSIEKELLPNVTGSEEKSIHQVFEKETDIRGKRISVVVTSLDQRYFDRIKELYLEHATETGELVIVHQPSHENFQQTEKIGHNRKAWAEICLLSFSNKLITSASSTFGYVAQGLAGIRPWILTMPENNSAAKPSCTQGMSLEPCFHAPPYYDCSNHHGADTSNILPFVRHCEDVRWGLKLFKDGDA